MNHNNGKKKLNRTSSHRKALLMNLATSMFEQFEHGNGQISTTLPKAKFVKGFIEKLITLAGDDNLHNRRKALAKLNNNNLLVEKLFTVIGKKYQKRPGGYLRIMKNGFRFGDCAPMAVLQFV